MLATLIGDLSTMSEDDHEEEFSHTFRRYVKSLERMAIFQDEQLKMAKQEIRKVHGISLEVTASELRQRLGDQAKKIREIRDKLASLPEDDTSDRYHNGPLRAPDGNIGPFRPAKNVLLALAERANMYIEWAAHLNPDKIYMISSHDWVNLFGDPCKQIW